MQSIAKIFYLTISIWITTLAVIGFWPTYFGPLFEGTLKIKPILHLHAVTFLGWMILIVLQALLVSIHRTDLHRKLGLIGAGYGVVIVLIGILTMLERFSDLLAQGDVRTAHASLVIPIFDLLLFVVFFLAALIYRQRPEIHKRLIIVSTLAFLGPAIARMNFLTSIPQIFVVLLSPILFGIAFDLIMSRRIHLVYIIGIIGYLVSAVRLPLRESEIWFKFSTWLFDFTV